MVAAEHLKIIIYEDFLLIFFQNKVITGGIFLNYGLIAICDEDSDYANSIAAYFRIKGSLASEIAVFTDYQNFSSYAQDKNIDILIIQEDFYDSIKQPSHLNLFVLCENQTREDIDDSHKIYKYNSAEEILRIIMANYDKARPNSCLSFHKYRKTKVIGVASPLGRCGKTSLALSLGLKLSQHHSCLFITFDECSPLRISLFKKESKHSSLTDIIYYFLQSMDISDNRILSCFQTFQGMDYILPSEQLETYSELQQEDLLNFLLSITGLGKYDYVIIDWGIFSYNYSALKICDVLLLPILKTDQYSCNKISIYLETLRHQYKDDTIQMKELALPHIDASTSCSEYTFLLTSQAMGNFCTSLIHELNS